MTYTLLIGQRSYSSWSLRGWLPFDAFDIPVRVEHAVIYGDTFYDDVAAFGGHRTVPVARTPQGGMLTDSLAIAWHLAEAFPDTPLLPSDPIDRATAQSLISEMHSGFTAIRSACPMNLRTAWADFEVSQAVQADLDRLEAVWGATLARSGGPFLFGDYSLADVFFAPVAIRIATYGLPVPPVMQSYVKAHLAHPPLRRWRALGMGRDAEVSVYDMDLPRRPFPAPPTIPASAVAAGPSVNATCPYSGGPVTHFADIGGRVWGFCNAGCRDKTVFDAEAWPAFMNIYHS
ncbi:MAG: glutathione S-transferase [Pseudomonadota bacterium]